MKHSFLPKQAAGFTLIELVVVIIILGILGVGFSGFIRSSVNQFGDFSTRMTLKQSSSFIVKRINRELLHAIPNSVRVRGNSNVHCVQFVPNQWATHYLNMPLSPSTDDTIDVVSMHDIAGNLFVPTTAYFAVIYPLDAADVYDAGQGKRRNVLSCSDDGTDSSCTTDDDSDSVVQIEVDGNFDQQSPASRVYFGMNAVSYCVRNNQMFRHESSLATTQPLYNSGGVQVADNLINSLSTNPNTSDPTGDDPFTSYSASDSRNAYTRVLLAFGQDDQIVSFLQEVHIPNVP
jgi:MSHA biogenesis protein MshO